MNEMESDEEVLEEVRLALAQSNRPIESEIVAEESPSLNKTRLISHCPSFLLKLFVYAFLRTSFLCEADVEQILQHWRDDLQSINQLRTNWRKRCAVATLLLYVISSHINQSLLQTVLPALHLLVHHLRSSVAALSGGTDNHDTYHASTHLRVRVQGVLLHQAR